MHHVEQFIYASSTSEMLLPDSTQAFFYVPLEEADKLITLWSEVHRKIYLLVHERHEPVPVPVCGRSCHEDLTQSSYMTVDQDSIRILSSF